jgi:hypothetical protein
VKTTWNLGGNVRKAILLGTFFLAIVGIGTDGSIAHAQDCGAIAELRGAI